MVTELGKEDGMGYTELLIMNYSYMTDVGWVYSKKGTLHLWSRQAGSIIHGSLDAGTCNLSFCLETKLICIDSTSTGK